MNYESGPYKTKIWLTQTEENLIVFMEDLVQSFLKNFIEFDV